jgi:hypothetical protein
MTRKFQFAASTLYALGSILLAGSAHALTVGDIEVKSGLGQRLDASIPVTLAAGEDITQACVRLEDTPSSKYKDVPAVKEYSMTIDRNAKGALIRITTPKPLEEPVVRVGLLIRCGAKLSTSREYMITQKLLGADKK